MDETQAQAIGGPERTPALPPSPSSVSESRETRKAAAAKAVDRLFGVCSLPDVADHGAFLSLAIAIFASYPIEVVNEVAAELPTRFKRPMLDDIRRACEAAYEPIENRRLRDLALRSLPPPASNRRLSKEEVGAVLKKHGLSLKRIDPAPVERNDGRHWDRVEADLAARKVRREEIGDREAGGASG